MPRSQVVNVDRTPHVSRPELTWWLLRRSFVCCYEDGCFGIAKGAAYSGLLSFIPVLTATAALLVQFNAERVSQVISQFLFIAVPPGTEDLVQYSFTVRGERPISVLVIATLVSLWAASGLMATLMEGFQAAYRLPSGRPFVQQRMVAILLVLIAAAPAITASALLVAGDRIENWALRALGLIPEGEMLRGPLLIASSVIRYGVAVAASVVAAAGMFYVGPNRRQTWRHIWPGAFVTTLLWLIATVAFGWYVRNIANYNVMYGSVGAVIALIVWMYVLAVVALLGCAYNAERERLFAQR
ncbi:MAG: YihY/virulence factor BrkB family protein [Bryobacterales bacterium]|nr:YihY/virulence factor BrkB family protein [Bryobacterales bacterium]